MNTFTHVTTSSVRNRGQLTIPDSIRKKVRWLSTDAIVNISHPQSDVLVITPHAQKVDWDMLWNSINLVRSFKGKIKNASQSIAQDREER